MFLLFGMGFEQVMECMVESFTLCITMQTIWPVGNIFQTVHCIEILHDLIFKTATFVTVNDYWNTKYIKLNNNCDLAF